MNNLTKRLLLWSILGLVFWLLCFAWFASIEVPPEMKHLQIWSCCNPMLWLIVLNRVILGSMVAIAWFMTLHPIFKFKIPAWLRWAKVWIAISLLLALWSVLWEPIDRDWNAFWMIIWAGVIMWAIIDLIITKIAWEWEDLIIKK